MTSLRDQKGQGISAFKVFPSQNSLEIIPFGINANLKNKTQSLSSFTSKIDLPSTKASSRNQFLRSYTNQISCLLNDDNEESPYTDLERIPSIELTLDEPLSSQGIKKKTNKLKTMVNNRSSNVVSHVRTCTSIGGDRPKVLLTSIRNGESSAHLTQNRSPLSNVDGQSHYIKSKAEHFNRGVSTSRIKENSQEKTWRITTQRGGLKLPTNPRESRINKILEEVQEKMDNKIPNYNNSKGYNLGLNVVKTEVTLDNSSPTINETTIKKVEYPNQKLGIADISKKLNEYRTVLNMQLADLHKVKPYTHIKNKSTSEENLFYRTGGNHTTVNGQDTIQKKEQIKRKFAKTINTILRKLSQMNLTIDEIIKNKVFSIEPYQRQGSKSFFDTVKNGDCLEIKRLIDRTPYLVYDFDSLKQTALHWAAKRGFAPVVKLLLERGADYDAQDLSGRTPLFLAAKGGFLNCVKLLLHFGADPTIKSDAGQLALSYTTDLDVRNILKKGYKIHVSLSAYSHKKFRQEWNLLDKRDFEVKKEQLLE